MDFPAVWQLEDSSRLASYIRRNAILFYNIVLCQTVEQYVLLHAIEKETE